MSKTGSETWQTLLDRALRALDSVGTGDWTLGGGTVLMLRYQHRLSRDIDVFIHDPQLLTRLSPRLNAVAAELTGDYVEQSSNLRLAFAEGEIDFVVAPRLLALEPEPMQLAGREILTDPSAEIVTKKLFYRGPSLKVRDVLDLALVLEEEPEQRERMATVLVGRAPQIDRRLTTLAPQFAARVQREVALLARGEALVDEALTMVRGFVAGIEG